MITVHLVNSKDHRLRKGYGMHLDLLVIAAQVALCSLFGLPWLVAATVRSMTHLWALSGSARAQRATPRAASLRPASSF